MFNFYVLHLLHANTSFNPKMCQTFWSVFQDGSAEVYRAYIKAGVSLEGDKPTKHANTFFQPFRDTSSKRTELA